MKNAEEWAQRLAFGLAYEKIVEEIQLDAWKQGMNDAAKIVKELEPSEILGIATAIYDKVKNTENLDSQL